jgi:serine protease Do
MYGRTMLKWTGVIAWCVAAACCVAADVLELGEEAAVVGKILAETREQIVVDVGYTVLLVPREHVVRLRRGATDLAVAGDTDHASAADGSRSAGGRSDSEPAEGWESEADEGNRLYASSNRRLPERSVFELVRELGEAVVQVRTPGGLGSGFFVNAKGYLITNFHVIEGETRISVEVYHQAGGQLEPRVYRDVRIVAMNKFADLALLKIEDKDSPTFRRVMLGDTIDLSAGEQVFGIGSPLGLERTVTEGIISTKTRLIQGELFLQTTAQINPGNSGGPLFNRRGEVVGVTNMKLTFGEGLGFAIPAERVQHFLDHRDAFAYDNDNPSNPYRYLEPPSRMKQLGENLGAAD